MSVEVQSSIPRTMTAMANAVEIPDREEIIRGIRTKRENEAWLDARRAQLRKRFPDQYVAVFRRRVVGADGDLHRLLALFRRKFPKTNPSLAAIDYMSKEDYFWVL